MNTKGIGICIVVLVVWFLGISTAFTISNEEIKELLVILAQLNVAIAVGVGALSISYTENKDLKYQLTQLTVAIAMLSLLSLLVAYTNVGIVARGYLPLNLTLICTLLLAALMSIRKNKK